MLVRIVVGILATVCALVALFVGGWVLWSLIALISVISVHELCCALGTPALLRLPSYAFAALYVPLIVFGAIWWALLLLVVSALYVFAIFAIFGGDGGKITGKDAIFAMFPFCYPLMFLFVFAFMIHFEEKDSMALFLLICGCPLLGDTFALFGGKLFGKHKLSPRVSPNKTVEGSVSGLVGGVAAAVIVFFLLGRWQAETTLWKFMLLGLLLSVAGQAGDLFASALKRYFGIKDFGKLLPGHGGILDRIDSVLFCAPVCFIVYAVNSMVF